ncbi:MAG: helix-turn-helix domain-containing protein [Flavobacteriales bacterium]|nr:helix-turn-helix domain-containing protein [Flavobacteriales bacterium]
MNVICLHDEAFFTLVEEVVERIKEKRNLNEDRWILPDEAMSVLGIKSKTTLQKLRDEGKIRFSQPQKKVILYDRESLIKYLDTHSKDVF